MIEYARISDKNVDAKQSDKQISSKPVESIKGIVGQTKNQSKKSQVSSKTKPTDIQSDELIINDETIGTKGMIIDESGIRMKSLPRRSQHPPVQPPLPPEFFKGLTPAQIRRWKRLNNTKQRIMMNKSPSPEPTP